MAGGIRFLRAQIAEIERDTALRWYGVAMAFLHVVTYLYWVDQRIAVFVGTGAEPICWPLVPDCGAPRPLSPAGVTLVLRAYFAAAVGTGLLFASRPLVPWAYAGLVLVNALKLAIMLLDYRLRMNQHYMAFFASFAYLFVPAKRDGLRVLITLFYFWAGTLKLNWEWISGAGLYRPMWPFSGIGVVVACVYVIVLELVVSWGLLAKRPWIFWAALAQFLFFHAMSWQVVGFFYPLLMFAILAIFPLSRLVAPADAPEGLLASLLASRGAGPVYALAVLVSLRSTVSPHGRRAWGGPTCTWPTARRRGATSSCRSTRASAAIRSSTGTARATSVAGAPPGSSRSRTSTSSCRQDARATAR